MGVPGVILGGSRSAEAGVPIYLALVASMGAVLAGVVTRQALLSQGSQKAVGSRAGSSRRLESRLVLFCIEASDSESRRIFQHFSKSTRVSHLCTASFQFFALFCNFSLIFPENFKKLRIYQQIKHFSLQISRIFDGIAANVRELSEVGLFCSNFLNFCRKTSKKLGKETPFSREPGSHPKMTRI